jgi:mannitol-specific phosphotransferase system IIBC component
VCLASTKGNIDHSLYIDKHSVQSIFKKIERGFELVSNNWRLKIVVWLSSWIGFGGWDYG